MGQGTFIFGNLTLTYEPKVIPSYVRKGVIHETQGGGLRGDIVAVKCKYKVVIPYLTVAEFDLLEPYFTALGNGSDIEVSFTWRDRVHDGATTNTKLGRILNKVMIKMIGDIDVIDEVYGSGVSDTDTTKAVNMVLEEV